MKRSIKIQPDVLSQTVDNEVVLLDLKNESYFGLNEVGARLWQLLQEGNDLEQVYAIIGNEYDVDAVALQQDLDKLVDDLVKAELLQVIEEWKLSG